MPSLQYYNAGGSYYSLDKSSGVAQKISSIPNGGATITWNGQGLPPELQAALGQPASSTPAVAPAISNQTPVYGSTNTSPNVAQPGQTQAATQTQTQKPIVPDSVYANYRNQIAAGTDPAAAAAAIQSLIASGQYSGNVDTTKLYAPLNVVKGGVTYGLNSDGSLKPLTGTTISNTVGAGGTTTSSAVVAAPGATSPAAAAAPTTAAPAVAPVSAPVTAIGSSLPGGTASNLYDYYSAQGKTLPAVADRAALYTSMGLGAAGTYTGTAAQNEDLLAALQRQDISAHNLGSSPYTAGAASTSTTALDSTDAGTALAAALSTGSASDSLAAYSTYLAGVLGASASKLSADTNALNSFFGTEKSATDILNDAMDAAGIPEQQSLLTELDAQITAQTQTLKDLPDAIKNSLADVGVSQDQLTRLVAKESKGPTDALNTLLQQRGATADEINTATSFAQKFADTQVADQAAKLAALEWMVNSDQGEYNNISASVKDVISQGITDQKTIMTTALTAAKNGASNDVIQSVLNSDSPTSAAAAAGTYLVKPATTTSTSAMSTDIKSSSSALELGVASKGYNGRGADGYVDPNLYVALYNAAQSQYGDAGAAAFIAAYPPAKDINPANIGTGRLPTAVENAVKAGQKKSSSSGIVIDSAAINAALAGTK